MKLFNDSHSVFATSHCFSLEKISMSEYLQLVINPCLLNNIARFYKKSFQSFFASSDRPSCLAAINYTESVASDCLYAGSERNLSVRRFASAEALYGWRKLSVTIHLHLSCISAF